MRYFFNVIDEPHEDEAGIELDDLEAAKLYAFHHARDILMDHHIGKLLCERMSMVVTDETGQQVYRLDISAAQPQAR